MRTAILIAALVLLPTAASAQMCNMLTIYSPDDSSPEARAFRAYPWISQCQERAWAAEYFRRADATKNLFESMAKDNPKSLCITMPIGNAIATICK